MEENKTIYSLKDYLARFAYNVKKHFVAKEHKTGSDTEYKVLSDNNLTDELKAKIEAAGDSNFSGDYTDLTNKPSIDGTAVDGSMTAEDLGLATRDWVGEQSFDTKGSVDQKIEDAKSDLEDSIASAVGSVYKPKGSCDFADLPELAAGIVGDVYNVTDVFVTDENFTEGAGLSYPAGTNVVCVSPSDGEYKWDVLAGTVDLSDYLKKSDLTPITDAEIDEMFE